MTNAASALTKTHIKKIFPAIAERYALIGRGPIGEASGFGAVWKAHDQWLDRDVALKFSDHDMAEELRLCRDSEGQTVRVYDYFRSESGWNAYAMELLESPWISLRSFIENHKYKTGDLQHYFDTFEIVQSMLSGLGHIHGRPYSRTGRFVHADIKPDNLFLRLLPKKRARTVFRLPAADTLVKIIDMGISTGNGQFLMGHTPAYSPKKHVARRGADMYAIAVTLLELLTGELPDHDTMQHKARIRTFVAKKSSGSAYFDELAIDFASRCATASSRPGETARVHLRYMDEEVFGIDGLELMAMRAIVKEYSGGAKKQDLADFLFGILAPAYQWQNRTEYRLAAMKEMVMRLYDKGMLKLRGQHYFPA